MREVRGGHRGYSWRVFYREIGGDSSGWCGEWKSPLGETGKTPLSFYASDKEAEEAVLACIKEHEAPTFTIPLEGE